MKSLGRITSGSKEVKNLPLSRQLHSLAVISAGLCSIITYRGEYIIAGLIDEMLLFLAFYW